MFKSAIVPAGAITLPVRPAPIYPRPRTNPAPANLDALLRKLHDHPDTIDAAFPDGHGGFTRPPPGALTYRPNDLLAAAVRLRDGTCRHPGCSVPAANCQLDHIVAYLHANPTAGGWTILANLQCLCVRHHQMKTDGMWHHEMLPGAVMHIHNSLGQHSLTLPTRRQHSDRAFAHSLS